MSGRHRWMRRTEFIATDDLRQIYEEHGTLFSIRMHHAGTFSKYPGRKYVGGTFTYFDLVSRDYVSAYELDRMVEELGYDLDDKTYYHFKKPDSDLDYGLLALACDQDIKNLLSYTDRYKTEVVIEEIEDDSPSKVVPTKSRVKKKLYLDWCDENVGTGKQNVNDDVNGDGKKPQTENDDDNPFLDTFFKELLKDTRAVDHQQQYSITNEMNDVHTEMNKGVNVDFNELINNAFNEPSNVEFNEPVNDALDEAINDDFNGEANDDFNEEQNDYINEPWNDEYEYNHEWNDQVSDELNEAQSHDLNVGDNVNVVAEEEGDFIEDDHNKLQDVEVDMKGFNLKVTKKESELNVLGLDLDLARKRELR